MVLTIGPVSAEAVPAKLMSTASGLMVGIGEVFGGGIAASLAGFGAGHFGIGSTLYMPIGALCCGLMAVASRKPLLIAFIIKSQSRLTTRTGLANSLKKRAGRSCPINREFPFESSRFPGCSSCRVGESRKRCVCRLVVAMFADLLS